MKRLALGMCAVGAVLVTLREPPLASQLDPDPPLLDTRCLGLGKPYTYPPECYWRVT